MFTVKEWLVRVKSRGRPQWSVLVETLWSGVINDLDERPNYLGCSCVLHSNFRTRSVHSNTLSFATRHSTCRHSVNRTLADHLSEREGSVFNPIRKTQRKVSSRSSRSHLLRRLLDFDQHKVLPKGNEPNTCFILYNHFYIHLINT